MCRIQEDISQFRFCLSLLNLLSTIAFAFAAAVVVVVHSMAISRYSDQFRQRKQQEEEARIKHFFLIGHPRPLQTWDF